MKNEKKLFALLDKYCESNEQLSTKELQLIIFLLGNEQEDECVTKWLQQLWKKNPEAFSDVNNKHIFDRVRRQIETNRSKRLSFMQFFYRVAAVFLFPLLGLSAYLLIQTITPNHPTHTEIVEISDPSGVRSKITLPDGSTIVLQEGIKLDLAANFLNGKTREVTFEGEAFFDIAHNPNKPFIIHTGKVKTTALGTSFSIKAQPGEASITVSVVEGKVKVQDGEKLLAVLEANQQFIYGIEPDHWQEKPAKVELDWQPHELIFRDMFFSDIAQDLAVRHGVIILIENEELKQQRISTLLDNRNSIDALLKFLCDLQHVTYTVEGKTYVIK